VASRVGVTGSQFHRYEKGATRVATCRLIAIARALDVRPERLMSEAESNGNAKSAPGASQPVQDVSMSGDLIEIVELYSSLRDPRRRGAIVAYARSLAGPFQSF
jgi:transcriptional regulator with XRE-family HTH domain